MKEPNIWVEKYKPKTIKDYVFPNEETETLVKSYVSVGELPNLILYGIQGVGKTSLVEVLLNEFDVPKVDVYRTNASLETGIENIRETIDMFCQTFPRKDFKVVIFEEADGLSVQAQKSLKSLMDKYAKTVRFIFTTNHPNRISPPIFSRCQSLEFKSFDLEKAAIHIMKIMESEGCVYDPAVMVEYIKKTLPDMRKLIQLLQEGTGSGSYKLIPYSKLSSSSSSDIQEWEILWKEEPTFEKAVKLVSIINDKNYEGVFDVIYNNIENLPEALILKAYLLIPQYVERAAVVANQEMNLRAYLIDIFDMV